MRAELAIFRRSVLGSRLFDDVSSSMVPHLLFLFPLPSFYLNPLPLSFNLVLTHHLPILFSFLDQASFSFSDLRSALSWVSQFWPNSKVDLWVLAAWSAVFTVRCSGSRLTVWSSIYNILYMHVDICIVIYE